MKTVFLIPKNGTVHEMVNNDEIVYITIKDKYSIIKLKSGKRLPVRRSLRQFEKILSADKFCRVHKCYIIAVAYVKSVELDIIHLEDEDIPFGREFKDAFLDRFSLP